VPGTSPGKGLLEAKFGAKCSPKLPLSFPRSALNRLMRAAEEGTLEPLKALRRELLDPKNRAAARDHD
jgi:hypothetical protein